MRGERPLSLFAARWTAKLLPDDYYYHEHEDDARCKVLNDERTLLPAGSHSTELEDMKTV